MVALSILLTAFLSSYLAQASLGQRVDENGYRRLAPGVITEIHPTLEEAETFSGPMEIVELMAIQPSLEWQPNYTPKSATLWSQAREAVFRRSVWALELGMKPLRMIRARAPDANGNLVSQEVWYLVYYVKNNGRHLNPKPQPDAQGHVTFTTENVDHSIRFFPTFILQCHDVGKAYLDQILPEAVEQIRQREDPRRPLLNSVTISDATIPVSTEFQDRSVWGVATWVGVDPRTDFFSVYIQGLTNAYRWQDVENGFRPGDPPGTGRRLTQKTLQLNYWRPGDAVNTDEREIRFGAPSKVQIPPGKTEDEILRMYRLPERVDYLWIYR